MAFRFPLTKNPHELTQDLRKVKTLNGTGDENAVATRSDADFQELSRRYQDYFHSDQVTISSSLNPSVPPSSSIRKNTNWKSERQCWRVTSQNSGCFRQVRDPVSYLLTRNRPRSSKSYPNRSTPFFSPNFAVPNLLL